MHNAKKIKDDILAEGHHVDNETLRQTYILPNFEKGVVNLFNLEKFCCFHWLERFAFESTQL
jgi:hypothetical protein